MKRHFFTLGICLALLQVAKPAEAQTMAKAQTTTTEIQTGQPQSDEVQANETKAATSEKSILNTKVDSGSGFEKGDFLLSPKLSIGPGGAISVDGEWSINDKFAVGAYVGYGTEAGYGTYYTYDVRRNIFGFGGKFVFHATGVFNSGFGWSIPAKLDLFANGYLGARILSYTNDYVGDTFYITPGVTVGARYFFSPTVGVFSELGYNTFGVFSVGMSFKF